MPTPLERLRRARRRFEEIPELKIIDDWVWDKTTECFFIHMLLDIGEGYSNIPKHTEWYITAEPAYPSGEIHIFPAVKNGIADTYPHQADNSCVEENGLWRKGGLCVNLITLSLGNRAFEREPGDIDERLSWYAQRAVLWVRAAASNELAPNGDVFELPSARHVSNNVCSI